MSARQVTFHMSDGDDVVWLPDSESMRTGLLGKIKQLSTRFVSVVDSGGKHQNDRMLNVHHIVSVDL